MERDWGRGLAKEASEYAPAPGPMGWAEDHLDRLDRLDRRIRKAQGGAEMDEVVLGTTAEVWGGERQCATGAMARRGRRCGSVWPGRFERPGRARRAAFVAGSDNARFVGEVEKGAEADLGHARVLQKLANSLRAL